MNIQNVGNGKVSLIAGGGRIYTDIAARFTRSERSMEEIISSSYDAALVERIVNSGHKAAVEFDYFVFGIEGYSRVTEAQLIRKRHASYLIKSGRVDKGGKRSYDVVLPDSIKRLGVEVEVPLGNLTINGIPGQDYLTEEELKEPVINVFFDTTDILMLLEHWYEVGVGVGLKEEDLRYMKPQATEFKAIIGMNAHALMDWFTIRMCKNAQSEIRDLAIKMHKICLDVAPDLFKNAGPSCKVLGYCPENEMQHPDCKVIRKNQAMKLLKMMNNKDKFYAVLGEDND